MLAQRIQADVADVDAIDRDAAFARIVGAIQQAQRRRLAGAGRTDDRDGAAGARAKTQVLERRMRDFVAERHIVERDLAARRRQLRRTGRFVQHLLRVEHAEEIAERMGLEEQVRI